MEAGRIIKGIGGFYYVDLGERVYECKARGIFRKNKLVPMVGDYVSFSITDESKGLGVIEEIKTRKTELIRPPVANVDQAVVVFAATQPEPNLSLLNRFLVLAESRGLQIIIVINKIDLAQAPYLEAIEAIYKPTGYPLIFTTKLQELTVDKLKKYLANQTTVFAGPSGVGKSTLLNKIQSNLVLETGAISSKTERGKHTTRHVELIPLEGGGWVVDTPGFSSLNVDFIEEQDLAHCFREFIEPMEYCRFSSCIHENEPHCGVKEAVERGKIAPGRYESYLQLLLEIRRNRRY